MQPGHTGKLVNTQLTEITWLTHRINKIYSVCYILLSCKISSFRANASKPSGFHIIPVKVLSPTCISLLKKKTSDTLWNNSSTYQAQMHVSYVWNSFLFGILCFTLHSTPKHIFVPFIWYQHCFLQDWNDYIFTVYFSHKRSPKKKKKRFTS